MHLENLKHGELQVIELIKMTASESIGGLFGGLITLGVLMWGAEKMGEALEEKPTKNKGKSFLDNTEPF
ncbi:hypothetical protein LCGC14_0687580 [marine sediment metagenome]|uniref:Uncharacterized protein n=1 Tax=marine sediment metagenome TaxID=412755 RepID=A0A0F9R6S3_9ZZZZ